MFARRACILAIMLERFYVNSVPRRGLVILQGAEAHHLAGVRRLRAGAEVCLFNGDGNEYRAAIRAVGRRQVELEILDALAVDRELPFRLIVACPLPKGDRSQFLVEKLTEVGVSSYVPLRTERSVIHPGENRKEKLLRYVIEASKQCGRNVLMSIEKLISWEEFVSRRDDASQKLLAHPLGGPLELASSGVDSIVAIGPEGGFTEDEVQAGRAAGWELVSLGPRTLRIETAALSIAAAVIHGAGRR